MISRPGTSTCPPRSCRAGPSWPPAPASSLSHSPQSRIRCERARGAGHSRLAWRWHARSRGLRCRRKARGPPRPGCCRARCEASGACWPRSSGSAGRCSPIPSAAGRATSRSRWPPRVRGPSACLVPATLAHQWSSLAERLASGRRSARTAGEPRTPSRPRTRGSSSSTRVTTSGIRIPAGTTTWHRGCWAVASCCSAPRRWSTAWATSRTNSCSASATTRCWPTASSPFGRH